MGDVFHLQDLDVLVLPPSGVGPIIDQEFVQQGLVNRNKQFFTRRTKDPAATYRALFHYIPQSAVLPPNFKIRECKVNTLLPGVMNLPYLDEQQVNEVDGLPVVPVLVLLLQKLQGWEEHFNCVEPHTFRKHAVDAEEIRELLEKMGEMPVRLFRPWSEREALGVEFVKASVERVKKFCVRFPETAVYWAGLGF